MDRFHWGAAVNVVAALLLVGCGTSKTPIAPAAEVQPAAQGFQLSGAVVDPVNRPLASARVEVIDGPRAGTVATTDLDGRFSMTGTFTGDTGLLATKDGYEPESRRVPPPGVRPPGNTEAWEVYFHLEPLGPVADVAGAYALTLTADRACTLPAEARTRTYTATVVATGRQSAFLGMLNGATFLSTAPWCPAGQACPYNRFGIGVVGDIAAVSIGHVEKLADTTYLAITGWAGGSVRSNGISAPLSGSFLYCPSEPYLIDQGAWACRDAGAVECDSGQHQLTLARR